MAARLGAQTAAAARIHRDPSDAPWRDSLRSVEEDAMARIIRCECGYVARGDTDDEVIDAIRAHMKTDHPALLESVGQEDLLGWIQVE